MCNASSIQLQHVTITVLNMVTLFSAPILIKIIIFLGRDHHLWKGGKKPEKSQASQTCSANLRSYCMKTYHLCSTARETRQELTAVSSSRKQAISPPWKHELQGHEQSQVMSRLTGQKFAKCCSNTQTSQLEGLSVIGFGVVGFDCILLPQAPGSNHINLQTEGSFRVYGK